MLFDAISLPGAPGADRVDSDDADFLLPSALMSDDGRLLGNDTAGEVDDVSITTERGGGSVG